MISSPSTPCARPPESCVESDSSTSAQPYERVSTPRRVRNSFSFDVGLCSCDQLACAPEFTCTTGHRRSCHHHHHRHHHRNHRHHHLKETAPPGEATSRINRDVGGWDINQRFGSLGNQIGSHLERAPSWKPSWVDISGRLEVPWALTVHVRTLQPHQRNLHEWGGMSNKQNPRRRRGDPLGP